jgi:hypothetical protein
MGYDVSTRRGVVRVKLLPPGMANRRCLLLGTVSARGLTLRARSAQRRLRRNGGGRPSSIARWQRAARPVAPDRRFRPQRAPARHEVVKKGSPFAAKPLDPLDASHLCALAPPPRGSEEDVQVDFLAAAGTSR